MDSNEKFKELLEELNRNEKEENEKESEVLAWIFYSKGK